jgi:UDP-N-acetylmuramate: L-alanyl-gamma-D-glutamyl-meso-diaminopimelate ligase
LHLHILGIGGTFMAGLARLAVELGHRVTGSDNPLYPPMSTQLSQLGIKVECGYDPAHLRPSPDLVVIGNAISRGNPAAEYVLSRKLPFTSGPEWLKHHVLPGKTVLAVAGTHGKTTVSSLLAWILEDAGLKPGFLIGGVPENFGVSARLGAQKYFVVEADEYDTAFFDKRSKFIHYGPDVLVLNNLEYDHADIFSDLRAIQTQIHQLIRTLPQESVIIYPSDDPAVDATLGMGCWSEKVTFSQSTGSDWILGWDSDTPQMIDIHSIRDGDHRGETPLLGKHNARNATAALIAAQQAGVTPRAALSALTRFASVKRRLELKAEVAGIKVFDDFAHHPTAIRETVSALKSSMARGRLIAVVEPRSNTMRLGVHRESLPAALLQADEAIVFVPDNLDWSIADLFSERSDVHLAYDHGSIVELIAEIARADDAVLIMSNGSFGNVHSLLIDRLRAL